MLVRLRGDRDVVAAVAHADDRIELAVEAEEARVGEPGLLDELEAARDARLQHWKKHA